MKSSSAAPRLRLKPEQASDGSKMQGSGLSNGLELRLGISSDNGSGGNDPWLGGGVHPWSLASRQEKAALEQAHQRPPPQPVGWPPVGAFRKSHLALAGTKAAEEPSKEKRCSGERPAASLFVKVNLEGCAVGRKVNLRAHRGYASLSRALQGMFHGFLSGQDSGHPSPCLAWWDRVDDHHHEIYRVSFIFRWPVLEDRRQRRRRRGAGEEEQDEDVHPAVRGQRGRPDARRRRAMGVSCS